MGRMKKIASVYIYSVVCKTGSWLKAAVQHRGANLEEWGGGGGVGWGGREAQEGGDTCIITADLLCCMAEANIPL